MKQVAAAVALGLMLGAIVALVCGCTFTARHPAPLFCIACSVNYGVKPVP